MSGGFVIQPPEGTLDKRARSASNEIDHKDEGTLQLTEATTPLYLSFRSSGLILSHDVIPSSGPHTFTVANNWNLPVPGSWNKIALRCTINTPAAKGNATKLRLAINNKTVGQKIRIASKAISNKFNPPPDSRSISSGVSSPYFATQDQDLETKKSEDLIDEISVGTSATRTISNKGYLEEGEAQDSAIAGTSDDMATSSKKRKLDEPAPTKYYAVRAGHRPGVYTSWPDCQQNITGFKGANYKSFLSEKDAKDFVAGKVVTGPSASSKPKEEKYYGVAVGVNPGVYTKWVDAQEQIAGVKGPKYKKFPTRAEAEEFVKAHGRTSKKATTTVPIHKKEVEDELEETVLPAAKKAKTAKTTTSSSSKSKVVKVYTDGSALGNGKAGSSAGVGVFFGVNDERNVSEALKGPLQTNQRAELTAVLRALEIVPMDQDIHIVTDSNYSINCCTVWYKSWVKKAKLADKTDWATSTGAKVINQDLVQPIRALIDKRDARGANTEFEWIKGHSNDPSNEAADRLAVAGARMSRQ